MYKLSYLSRALLLGLVLLVPRTAVAQTGLAVTNGTLETGVELTWSDVSETAFQIAIYRSPQGEPLDEANDLIAGVASSARSFVDTSGELEATAAQVRAIVDRVTGKS